MSSRAALIVLVLALAGCMSATAITVTPGTTVTPASTTPGGAVTAPPPATLARSTAPRGASAQPPSRTPRPSATPTARPAQPTRPSRTPAPAATAVVTSGPFRLVVTIDPAVDGFVYGLRPDPAAPGHLQVITEHGYMTVRMADGHTWSQAAYPYAVVIGVDAAGFIWMLRDDGDAIYATDGMSDRAYGPESGWTPVEDYRELAGNGVIDDPDAPGVMWLATDQDYRRLDGGRWTTFTRDDMGMAAPETEDMFPRYDMTVLGTPPRLWAFGCDWGGPGPAGGPGARWLEGDTWRGADSPVASGCITEVVADSMGRVWVARHAGLWRFDPASAEWEQHTIPAPSGVRSLGYTIELPIDPAGNPWPLMSICGGASCEAGTVRLRLAGGQWTQVPEPGEVFDYDNHVAFDSEGTPWLFVLGETYRMENGAWVEVAGFGVGLIARDAEGQLWVLGGPDDGPIGIWKLQAQK